MVHEAALADRSNCRDRTSTTPPLNPATSYERSRECCAISWYTAGSDRSRMGATVMSAVLGDIIRGGEQPRLGNVSSFLGIWKVQCSRG